MRLRVPIIVLYNCIFPKKKNNAKHTEGILVSTDLGPPPSAFSQQQQFPPQQLPPQHPPQQPHQQLPNVIPSVFQNPGNMPPPTFSTAPGPVQVDPPNFPTMTFDHGPTSGMCDVKHKRIII